MTTTEEKNETMVISVSNKDFLTVDDVMMNEEEKMMEDEEVTSVESEGDMEENMFTVAVLNSLVENHEDPNGSVDLPIPDVGPTSGGGDPRPDAAPSSLDDSSRGRKRVREDNDKKLVPNPLSRPRDLPNLKPGKFAESMNRCLGTTNDEKGNDDLKKKVAFSNQLEASGRSRGFSIDLDSCTFAAWQQLWH